MLKLPKPHRKETLKDYLDRAIPEMMGEGLKQKQAVGKAYGMYRDKGNKKRKKGK